MAALPFGVHLARRSLGAQVGRPVKRGVFGAAMEVELVNDGPATFFLQVLPPA